MLSFNALRAAAAAAPRLLGLPASTLAATPTAKQSSETPTGRPEAAADYHKARFPLAHPSITAQASPSAISTDIRARDECKNVQDAGCRAKSLALQPNLEQPLLEQLLCSPLAFGDSASKWIRSTAAQLATSAVVRAGQNGNQVLTGEQLREYMDAILADFQALFGIDKEHCLQRIEWSSMRMGKHGEYSRQDDARPGASSFACREALSCNTDDLLFGLTVGKAANVIAHELFHKRQYMVADALFALRAANIDPQSLIGLPAATRKSLIEQSWRHHDRHDLIRLAVTLTGDAEILAIAQLTTKCIEYREELAQVPGSNRTSVLEQMAYALGDSVQEAVNQNRSGFARDS